MKIIRPYMKILTDSKEALNFANWCGRISHRSEDAENQDVERFLRNIVLQHGDWSITEHVNISVDAVVDRGITHEIVRHRIGAYTQESTRFVNYNKTKDGVVVRPPSFIYPDSEVECEHCFTGVALSHDVNCFDSSAGWYHCIKIGDCRPCALDKDWLCAIEQAERSYKALVAKKWAPQKARSVFPNALSSRIVITYNLRSWRHFFLMRTTAEAHPQMRQVTIPLLTEFQKAIPVLYEDIEPNGKQSENLKKGR